MFLKSLEIQGFKSFPDKTKIAFQKGITAVVGPNGSGKSNISDAIRWVLGETSSKQLRGSGKMEDVIFGGTQYRSPMGYAAVSLEIDNSDHRLDVDKDDVVVTRRYYRSGESEYAINGQNVRLRDVYELFLDTGLGRDGYSIISQGRISEVISSRPDERREIFEEASGISKTRYRKEDAERKLDGVETNLVRLRDIQGELSSRVEPLRAESEKAQSFLDLSDRKKKYEVTLWSETLERGKEDLRKVQRDLDTVQKDYDSISESVSGAEMKCSEIRHSLENVNIESDKISSEIIEMQESSNDVDKDIAVMESKNEYCRKTIGDLEDKIRDASKSDEESRKAIEDRKKGLDTLRIRKTDLEAQLNDLGASLQAVIREAESKQADRAGVSDGLSSVSRRLQEINVSIAAAQNAEDNAEQTINAGQSRIAENQEQSERTEKEITENDRYLETCRAAEIRLGNIRDGLSMKLTSCRERLTAAQDDVRRVDSQMSASGERIRVLSDLERSMDGYNSSVRHVLNASKNHLLRGITGPVSQVIKVRTGYELAVETALGFAAQNIVVDDETAAKEAIALLKKDHAGRATFMPIDTVRPSSADSSKLSSGAVFADSLVEYDPQYRNIVSSLLGRIAVVEDLDAASSAARKMEYRYRVVTRDGQVINAGGSYTGGSTSRAGGFFTRHAEIEKLQRDLAEQEKFKKQKSDSLAAIQAEFDRLTAQSAATESERLTASEDIIRSEAEKKRLEEVADNCSRQKTQLHEDMKRAEETKTALAKQIASQKIEMTECSKKIIEYQNELDRLSARDSEFADKRKSTEEKISDCRLQSAVNDKEISTEVTQIDEMERMRISSAQQLETARASVAEQQQIIRENDETITGLRKSKTENSARIEAKKLDKQRIVERRIELTGEETKQNEWIRSQTDRRENLSREIARLEGKNDSLSQNYDSMTKSLWDEYGLTPSDAQKECVEYSSAAQLKRDLAAVKQSIKDLGNVNVGAIEEYRQVSERCAYLTSQITDVEKSREELNGMISHLSEEMKEKFVSSFSLIRQNFSRIFAELFGGGRASLSLTDENDILNTGIDINVAPPGKIINNLSALSGGEQALVAIAIYFSILAVNPAPFCVLDEIEAALDDVNVARFASYLQNICGKTQFIVITHRRGTMEAADVLFGVTMQEDGVSKILELELDSVDVKMVN